MYTNYQGVDIEKLLRGMIMKENVKHFTKGVTKAILVTVAAGGIAVVGATAPGILRAIHYFLEMKKIPWRMDEKIAKRKVTDAFTYLRRRGLVRMGYQGKQLYISLTPRGKKLAKKLNIDSLQIHRTKAWDKRWRLILFDIREKIRIKRDALRGKLKELGFFQVQKSVWLHAFPCEKELHTLMEFFGLDDSQCLCFEVNGLPTDLEEQAKKYFHLGN